MKPTTEEIIQLEKMFQTFNNTFETDFYSFIKNTLSEEDFVKFNKLANVFHSYCLEIRDVEMLKTFEGKKLIDKLIQDKLTVETNYIFLRTYNNLYSQYLSFKQNKNIASSARLFQDKSKNVIKADLIPKLFSKKDETLSKEFKNIDNKPVVKLFQTTKDKQLKVADNKELDISELKPDPLLLKIEKRLLEFIGKDFFDYKKDFADKNILHKTFRVMKEEGIIPESYSFSAQYIPNVKAIIQIRIRETLLKKELEKN